MPSKLKQREVSKAQVGPRELKDPRSKEYAIQTVYALKRYVESKIADEELISKELDEIRKYKHWEILGYKSEDELLTSEVGMDRAAVQARAKGIKPSPSRKDSPGGRGNKSVDNVNSLGGNNADYLTARIARDHPEVLEDMKAGKYKSVRAAAKAAGIIKERTALSTVIAAWKKLTDTEKHLFTEWLKDNA